MNSRRRAELQRKLTLSVVPRPPAASFSEGMALEGPLTTLEPFLAMAEGALERLTRRLASEGLGVVLVSSDLPELLGLSHRVLVLNLGRQTALLEGAAAAPEAVMAAATART